jgi:hypothetical protein
MKTIPDQCRWYAIRLAARTSPSVAARRIGIRVDELARVCAGFPVSRRALRAVAGAATVSAL